MILRLKMKNASFFHNITKIAQGPFAYALEFPKTAVRAHGTNFSVLATFRLTNCDLVIVKENPLLKQGVFACHVELLAVRLHREEENKACLPTTSFAIARVNHNGIATRCSDQWCKELSLTTLILHRHKIEEKHPLFLQGHDKGSDH